MSNTLSKHALASLPTAAAHLRLSPRTLRRYVQRGRLRPVMIGGRPAFPWTEIWRLLDLHPPRGREAAFRLPLMTAEEVAALCGGGISAAHVKTLARRGELPGRRLAKGWVFIPAEIDAWLFSRGA